MYVRWRGKNSSSSTSVIALPVCVYNIYIIYIYEVEDMVVGINTILTSGGSKRVFCFVGFNR